jgi:hypothetical protein
MKAELAYHRAGLALQEAELALQKADLKNLPLERSFPFYQPQSNEH